MIDYNHSRHSDLRLSPANRWQLNGFLPHMVESLEHLDLLLLSEAKSRKVLRDGIHFQGLRYMDPILADYVNEFVHIRYNSNSSDITSIRVFYKDRFLCQPLCTELSQAKISIKEIQQIRYERRKKLGKRITERKSLVDAVIEASRRDLPLLTGTEESALIKEEKPQGLKLYEYE